jgi:hypothetical protein
VKLLAGAGVALLELDPEEIELLSLLFEDLSALLDDPDADDAVLRRLNPEAYPGDADAEAEFRSLTASGLRTERDDRIAACRADLAAGTPIDLTDDDLARRWLQVLNDLRLALGTRLGVTQDDRGDIDPDDPAAQPWLVYAWLTALQDAVVDTILP